MTIDQHQIQFSQSIIEYRLSYSPRKTLSISVHPDLRVTLDAPEQADFAAVEAKLRKSAAWILKQQRELAKYHPHLPARQ